MPLATMIPFRLSYPSIQTLWWSIQTLRLAGVNKKVLLINRLPLIAANKKVTVNGICGNVYRKAICASLSYHLIHQTGDVRDYRVPGNIASIAICACSSTFSSMYTKTSSNDYSICYSSCQQETSLQSNYELLRFVCSTALPKGLQCHGFRRF